jgi:hypothetical protein
MKIKYDTKQYEEKINQLLEAKQTMMSISNELEFGDPFASYRIREILLSIHLNHTIAHTLHFEDARNEFNEKIEYKTCTISRKGLYGRYDISWQDSWERQKEYMLNEKIANNAYHYFALFDKEHRIQEIYRMKGDTVYNLLLPKIEKKFKNRNISQNKNGSLHATISNLDIMTYGEKIYTVYK